MSTDLPDQETLIILASWGRIETIKQIQSDLSMFIDEDKNNLLHIAARHAQADLIRYLREETTVSVTQTNADGFTPLDLANGLRPDRFNRAETIAALNANITSKIQVKKVNKK
jgi:hypothetical protein